MEDEIISSIGNKYAVSVRAGRLLFLLTTIVVFSRKYLALDPPANGGGYRSVGRRFLRRPTVSTIFRNG